MQTHEEEEEEGRGKGREEEEEGEEGGKLEGEGLICSRKENFRGEGRRMEGRKKEAHIFGKCPILFFFFGQKLTFWY